MPEHDADQLSFVPNPNGAFATLFTFLQRPLLSLARLSYPSVSHEVSLADFVDRMAQAWLDAVVAVDVFAKSNGFLECTNLYGINASDRSHVALLALTINGSTLLLGNGCLTPEGSFARYTRLVLRRDTDIPPQTYQESGVHCDDASVSRRLTLQGAHSLDVTSTSPLYCLFYTTRDINDDAIQAMCALHQQIRAIFESVQALCTPA